MGRNKGDLTLNRDWVRIFSVRSMVGMRSLKPPSCARSTLWNPLRSRTWRQMAFIIRRLRV
jgi:hypothetical protein